MLEKSTTQIVPYKNVLTYLILIFQFSGLAFLISFPPTTEALLLLLVWNSKIISLLYLWSYFHEPSSFFQNQFTSIYNSVNTTILDRKKTYYSRNFVTNSFSKNNIERHSWFFNQLYCSLRLFYQIKRLRTSVGCSIYLAL